MYAYARTIHVIREDKSARYVLRRFARFDIAAILAFGELMHGVRYNKGDKRMEYARVVERGR